MVLIFLLNQHKLTNHQLQGLTNLGFRQGQISEFQINSLICLALTHSEADPLRR